MLTIMGLRAWIFVENVLVPFLGRARMIGIALVGWVTAVLISTLLGGNVLRWLSFAAFVFFAACCTCAFIRWAKRHEELFPPGGGM